MGNFFDSFFFSVSLDSTELYLGEWVARDCADVLNGVLCERNRIGEDFPTNPTTAMTTTPSAKCGAGWLERPLTNLCYIFTSMYDSYRKNLEYCEQMGASLVSISNYQEQLFLQSTILISIYIDFKLIT